MDLVSRLMYCVFECLYYNLTVDVKICREVDNEYKFCPTLSLFRFHLLYYNITPTFLYDGNNIDDV